MMTKTLLHCSLLYLRQKESRKIFLDYLLKFSEDFASLTKTPKRECSANLLMRPEDLFLKGNWYNTIFQKNFFFPINGYPFGSNVMCFWIELKWTISAGWNFEVVAWVPC